MWFTKFLRLFVLYLRVLLTRYQREESDLTADKKKVIVCGEGNDMNDFREYSREVKLKQSIKRTFRERTPSPFIYYISYEQLEKDMLEALLNKQRAQKAHKQEGNRMKKFLLKLIGLSMLASLASCGGSYEFGGTNSSGNRQRPIANDATWVNYRVNGYDNCRCRVVTYDNCGHTLVCNSYGQFYCVQNLRF